MRVVVVCAIGKNRATAAAHRGGVGIGGVGVWRKGDRGGALGRKFDCVSIIHDHGVVY